MFMPSGHQTMETEPMKYVALLAAVLLAASAGTGMAQSQTPSKQQRTGSPATSGQADPRGTGITGAPSSSNPQAAGGGAAYQTPREVPENGGAPTTTNPNPNRR